MKILTEFTKDFERTTGRKFLLKMMPLEVSTSKVYISKQTQMPMATGLQAVDYTPKGEIKITLDTELNETRLAVAKMVMEGLAPAYHLSPAYQRFLQGYDQEKGVYDDDNDDDQTNNDAAFENWYSRNGAFAKAALKDNDAEAYKIAFDNIDWSECNWDELEDLISCIATIEGSTPEVSVRKYESIPCSRLFFNRKKYSKLYIPKYIKGDALYREAIGELTKKFSEDINDLLDRDSMSLVEQIQLDKVLSKDIDWSNGLQVRESYYAIIRDLRRWLTDKFATISRADESEIEIPVLEMIDNRINEYLSEAIESIRIYENLSDSMKLNPLTEEEFNNKAWFVDYSWIHWEELDINNATVNRQKPQHKMTAEELMKHLGLC